MKKFSSIINKINLIFALFNKNGFLNCKVVSVVALGSSGQKLESKIQKSWIFKHTLRTGGTTYKGEISPYSFSIKFTQILSNNI